MRRKRILVVDDEPVARELISDVLARRGYSPSVAADGGAALEALKRRSPDLVLLDLRLPDMSGIEVLSSIRKSHPDLPVVLFSAYGTVDAVVKAMKLGAYDFVEKPLDVEHLMIVVRNALEQSRLLDEVTRLRAKVEERYRLVGSSKVMQTLRKRIRQAAASKAHVLITGRTGSGKDLVARAIHNQSDCSEGPFVKLNCAAIPHELVESELFGYRKGAFSGAYTDKEGRIEAADGGTIFFDEIGDMPPAAQAKLLHFLESSAIERLGETQTRKVNVRVVAATNRELLKEVKARRFREDLYYRLNVIDIHVPPLQEHPEDIPKLAEHFLERACRELGVPTKMLDESALKSLVKRAWPGNVRELRNTIEKAASLSSGLLITAHDLPAPADSSLERKPGSFAQARRMFERRFLQETLEAEDWNVTAAAKRLGMDRTTLYRKLKALGLSPSLNR